MAEETKEHEYELVDHSGKDGETLLGTAWWDGKKVQSSSPKMHSILERGSKRRNKDNTVTKLTMKDGIRFLDSLPSYYSSYVSARKVEK